VSKVLQNVRRYFLLPLFVVESAKLNFNRFFSDSGGDSPFRQPTGAYQARAADITLEEPHIQDYAYEGGFEAGLGGDFGTGEQLELGIFGEGERVRVFASSSTRSVSRGLTRTKDDRVFSKVKVLNLTLYFALLVREEGPVQHLRRVEYNMMIMEICEHPVSLSNVSPLSILADRPILCEQFRWKRIRR